MSIELDFELDISGLVLDETVEVSTLLDMELTFEETLDFELDWGGPLITDSPEYADVLITSLKSADSIPAAQAAWLGAAAKSVLSYIIKIVEKLIYIYPQVDLVFTGILDLTKVDNHYSDYAQTGVLDITIASDPIVGGSAEITITADGNLLTVTGATNYGDTAIDYTYGKINHFMFYKFSHGIYYVVKQLN